MGVYLRTKFQVSSIILMSFRQGVILPLPPPQNEPLKSPPRLGSKFLVFWCNISCNKYQNPQWLT